jgi:hypothetical protein
MSALNRPVLRPPCEQCGEPDAHADECEGEPRPETLSQALARARSSADKLLLARVRRYLDETAIVYQRGRQAKGKYCSNCRDKARYPDHHCAEHTMYLVSNIHEAREIDGNPELYLGIWREFFERVGAILKS